MVVASGRGKPRFSINYEVGFYEAKPPFLDFVFWEPVRGVFWGKVGYGQINSVMADQWICRATSVLGEIRHRERRRSGATRRLEGAVFGFCADVWCGMR